MPYLVHVAENNELSLLTVHIWLVGSFVSRVEFTDTPYLVEFSTQ